MRPSILVMIFLFILCMPILIACGKPSADHSKEKIIGIANPASVHCHKMGGSSETRKEENGETSYCHLPDGRVIEEWELFRSSRNNDLQ